MLGIVRIHKRLDVLDFTDLIQVCNRVASRLLGLSSFIKSVGFMPSSSLYQVWENQTRYNLIFSDLLKKF